MNKSIIIVVILVIIIGAGIFFFISNDNSEDGTTNTNTSSKASNDSSKTNESTGAIEIYTSEDVALHNSSEDCWMIIGENIYDVTNYTSHPSEDSIFQGCGIDATSLFENRPNGSGSHSLSAQKLKEDYFLGILQ